MRIIESEQTTLDEPKVEQKVTEPKETKKEFSISDELFDLADELQQLSTKLNKLAIKISKSC